MNHVPLNCTKCTLEIGPGERYISFTRHVERLTRGKAKVEEAELLSTFHLSCEPDPDPEPMPRAMLSLCAGLMEAADRGRPSESVAVDALLNVYSGGSPYWLTVPAFVRHIAFADEHDPECGVRKATVNWEAARAALEAGEFADSSQEARDVLQFAVFMALGL